MMAPFPDAEVTALGTLLVGSPATEIIRRNNEYIFSFVKKL